MMGHLTSILEFMVRSTFLVGAVLGTSSARSQLQTLDLNNQPVTATQDASWANGTTDMSSQISPEEYQRIMKELQAAKLQMEERNKMLDQLLKDQ